MIRITKWKVASLTLLTFPLTIWFADRTDDDVVRRLLIDLSFMPLIVACSMELYAKAMSRKPDPYGGVSAAGNKIAGILAVVLFCTVLFIYLYRAATH